MRSTSEIFEDHLQLALQGDVATDIERNYSPDCVLLTTYGIYRNREGIMEAAELLQKQLPDALFRYTNKMVQNDIAFLEWKGESYHSKVDDGADTFLIRNGRIVVQTIHYTVRKKGAYFLI